MQKTETIMTDYEKLFGKISLDTTTPLMGILRRIPSEYLLQELLRRNQEQREKEAKEQYEKLIADSILISGSVISSEYCENDNFMKTVGIRLDDKSVEKLGIMPHQRTIHYKHAVLLIGPCYEKGDKVNIRIMGQSLRKYWPPIILEVEKIEEH